MFGDKIEKMEEGKDKELLKLMSDAKPYIRKADGYAIKISEDKEITYKDYEGQENVLKVPAGSVIITNEDSCYPKVITSEEFESKNKFLEGEKVKEVKKEEGPKVGMALIAGEQSE